MQVHQQKEMRIRITTENEIMVVCRGRSDFDRHIRPRETAGKSVGYSRDPNDLKAFYALFLIVLSG